MKRKATLISSILFAASLALLAKLVFLVTHGATLVPEFITVSANTNGVLRGPTNFFSANYVMQSVRATTISNLLLIAAPPDGTMAFVDAYDADDTEGGGGGQFIYNASATTSTNRGIDFLIYGDTTGRWFRVHEPGIVYVRWFGAKGPVQAQAATQGPDDFQAIDAALAYADEYPNTTVELGSGDFMISATLCVPPYTTVKGISPSQHGDWIGDFTTIGLDDAWWTHNHARTRIYPQLGFTGYMMYVGITNRNVPGTAHNSVTSHDGTTYTNYYYGTHLENFQLEGYVNRANRFHGIFIDRAAAVTLEGVAVSVISGHPIRVEGTVETRIVGCAFENFVNRSLPYLFMRAQDSQVHDTIFASQPLWLESCGENGYINNLIYNVGNFGYDTNGWQYWNNVTSSVGENFTAETPAARFITGMPVVFLDAAPSGFNTNDTYWPYVVSESGGTTTFKLNSRLGVLGQGSGARDGYGVSAGEVGTYTLSTLPPSGIYMRNCINGYFGFNRVDQHRQSAYILSGPYCKMNTVWGDTLLNLGLDKNNTSLPLPGINVTDPWYAGFFVKDGAYANTLYPAQVHGAIGDWDPPWMKGNLTAFVIDNGCDYNQLGGGLWNAKTNYAIGETGTANTVIRGIYNKTGDFIGSPRVPVSQRLQGGIYMDRSTAPIINVPTSSFVIGTNDFTVGALVTWPASDIFAGIFSLGGDSASEGGSHAWVVLSRSDELIEVTRRASDGSLAYGDYSANYYRKPSGIAGREMWVVVTRTGSDVKLYVDGAELEAFAPANTADFATSVGDGTNYWHIGRNSNLQSLTGKIVDAGLFNFAMTSSQVTDLRVAPMDHKWLSGSPYVTVSSGSLVEGKEYRIMIFASGDSFTSSGASANADGTVFVYNGTAPTWSNGSVLLRRGIVAWPNFSRGYGTTFPDRTVNGFDATYTGTVHHLFSETQPAYVGTAQTFTAAQAFSAAGTFSAAGAASTPGLTISGAAYTAGSATTSKPQLLLQPSGPASANWSASGTYLGIDAPAAFGGNLFDFQHNDTSYFRGSSAGNLTVYNNFTLGASGQIAWSGRGALTSPASGVVQFGAADASSINSQKLRTQGIVDGTTNTVGKDFTVQVSPGTGTGAGGSFIVHVAPAGSTGTTQNTLVAALTIDSTKLATFTGNIAVPKTITAGGTTGAQTIDKMAGSVNFAAGATQLTVTCNLVTTSSVIVCTVGTNDTTMKSVLAVAGSGSFVIYPNAVPTAETRVNFLVVN